VIRGTETILPRIIEPRPQNRAPRKRFQFANAIRLALADDEAVPSLANLRGLRNLPENRAPPL
jgi:hypothetical protein